MMDIGIEANLQQFGLLFAAFVGNFIATLPPFWKEKFKFAQYDIKIFFDYKFLGTALVTGLGSFAFVSALMNTIDSQIPQNTTFVFALITAFTIGLLGNKGVNALLPPPNVEQKKELQQKIESEVISEHENQKMVARIQDGEIDWSDVKKDSPDTGEEKTNDSGTS